MTEHTTALLLLYCCWNDSKRNVSNKNYVSQKGMVLTWDAIIRSDAVDFLHHTALMRTWVIGICPTYTQTCQKLLVPS